MTELAEFYVEIELPRGDTTGWAVVGEPMDQPTANELYDHFLDSGIRVRMTTWTLQVVRAAPEQPEVHPATAEESVQEFAAEAERHGIKLPSVEDLVAKVKADMHAVEHEVEHLAEQGAHLIGEIPHPHRNSENPGPDDAAEQPVIPLKPIETPFNSGTAASYWEAAAGGGIAKAADTSPDIAAKTPAEPAAPDDTVTDLLPGDPGYIKYMISRSDQGTRVSRQQV